MQKRLFSILLLLVILLSACAPKDSNAAAGTPIATEAVSATDTSAAEAGTEATPQIVASGPAECRTVSMFGDGEEPAPIPEVTDEDWITGNVDAPVTILVYSDYQCPYCALMDPTLEEYVTANPDKARLVFRNFPLEMHDKSNVAALMVEAAGKQGQKQFEALRSAVFASQSEWTSLDEAAFIEYVKTLAGTLDIDTDQLATDMEDADLQAKIEAQTNSGYEAGVSYTPYIVINNLLFQGELTSELMDEIVATFESIQADKPADYFTNMPHFLFSDAASLQAVADYYDSLVTEKGQEYADSIPYYLVDNAENTAIYIKMYDTLKATIMDRQFDACPETVIDTTKTYKAILKTEKGDITITLFPEAAPVTVNSFVFLAKAGWFDDITFHRVIPDFVAQTGDPSGLGIGNPGYMFDNEINPDYLFDQPGRVGMANSGEGTNGSQFFITYAATPNLNGTYTVFGQVESGLEILQELSARNINATEEGEPGSKLISVEIIEE
jgi:cyclophilin family peptidyl-prolyl cis-trans isomerase/protein-disulfide isomerase